MTNEQRLTGARVPLVLATISERRAARWIHGVDMHTAEIHACIEDSQCEMAVDVVALVRTTIQLEMSLDRRPRKAQKIRTRVRLPSIVESPPPASTSRSPKAGLSQRR